MRAGFRRTASQTRPHCGGRSVIWSATIGEADPRGETMLKKIAYGALATTAVGTFVFGRDAWSYVTTGVTSVREAVRGEVPVEFEIERARQAVDDLVPEIRKSMHVIAKEQVEVEHLQQAVASRETALQKQEVAILALRAHLKSGDNQYVVHGRSYNQDDVKEDLSDRFSRFQVATD